MKVSKPRDVREFVRLSVTLPSHPKLARIDDARAAWLYVVGICHAGEHLTDGLLTPNVVYRLAGVTAKWGDLLIREELWHQHGHACETCPQPPEGQVVIHDYLEHQRSRAEAEDLRERRSQAGAKGAASRWQTDGKSHSKSDGKRYGKTMAEVEVEEEEEKNQQRTTSSVARNKSRGTRLPPDFEPSEDLITWAKTHTPHVGPADHDRFIDYWTAIPGQRGIKLDWDATWRNWMRKAEADRPRTVNGQRPGSAENRLAKSAEILAQLRAEQAAPRHLNSVIDLSAIGNMP